MLACSFLDDLLELRDNEFVEGCAGCQLVSRPPSALRVYGQYLNLDTDHNGMLNQKELSSTGREPSSPVFVERVLKSALLMKERWIIKTYLTLVLAMEK